MFSPTRLAYAVRPHAPLPIVAAAVSLAAMFAATPYLIQAIAFRYDVSPGTAGTISVIQVGAFAMASFVLPRIIKPTGSLLRWAGVAFLLANAGSAGVSEFALLLMLRLIAGVAAGTITWIVWDEAMSSPRSMASISSVAPFTALVGSPILAVVSDFGDQQTYGLLTLLAIPTVLLKVEIPTRERSTRKVSRSRSNRVLLGALMLLAFSGSSLFVFAAVAAVEVLDLPATTASFAYSLNAGAGLLGVRLASRHRRPGWWLLATGPAAILTIFGGHAVWFFIGLSWWGFAFWMGVPGVLLMIAERSLTPGERAGDTQAFMALGRTTGPILGGFLTNGGDFGLLAITAGVGMAAAGGTVIGVQEGRERLPPTPA